ncbi:Retrovirus-related Pol polyprotein from transposon TNT 1-94 [Gossypium australe]|uniref:Retrovirus-related Pol polyprotein from transposon TNT 1-94 n=1 Tax=Gossypium australe TaxID=47621 RepID=A0A5B6WSH6_9ROSI|nr:Retrovirus-related Pol polyprotein from transposon TNT 1-94 [Gossypium australe]
MTDENGIITHNKARLVAQERIYFDKTFVPVALLEVVRLLLVVTIHFNIKLYQMDVKSIFSHEFLK